MFIGRADVAAVTPILWPPDVKSWLIGKDPDAGKDWRQEKGTTEDEMAGWHHWLDGHEFGWTLGAGDEQGGLACCSPRGHKELDTTEQFNWTDIMESLEWSVKWTPEGLALPLLLAVDTCLDFCIHRDQSVESLSHVRLFAPVCIHRYSLNLSLNHSWLLVSTNWFCRQIGSFLPARSMVFCFSPDPISSPKVNMDISSRGSRPGWDPCSGGRGTEVTAGRNRMDRALTWATTTERLGVPAGQRWHAEQWWDS